MNYRNGLRFLQTRKRSEGEKMIIRWMRSKIKWRKQLKRWHCKNKHNHCEIQSYFDMDKVTIGNFSYGMINAHIYENEAEHLQIGSFCSIAENVHFVFAEHNYKRFSTFPFDEYVINKKEHNSTKGPIVIEDDVWIGMNCTILSGVTIHRGAIIGAGTVVTKDVPPYAIYANGKVIKYRFEQEIIDKLMKIDYNKLTKELIEKNIDYIKKELTEDFWESELYQSLVD
ncbi:MAG: CatB-related O-acetyltransferase [Lachnospiraceae bacterium]|nr:CatB-related O-acetyltransferase [Lachnospiraceae bacterium]